MARGSSAVRARLVAGAADLLRRRGFTATSMREVAKHSGAPFGSTYHYFPGGKPQLTAEAVRLADGLTKLVLADGLTDPRTGLAAFVEVWRNILRDSQFSAGCPVVAVAVDSGADAEEPRAAAACAFAGWQAMVATALGDQGVDEDAARHLAALVVASIEGAVVMARAERSTEPLDEVEIALDGVLARALDGAER